MELADIDFHPDLTSPSELFDYFTGDQRRRQHIAVFPLSSRLQLTAEHVEDDTASLLWHLGSLKNTTVVLTQLTDSLETAALQRPRCLECTPPTHDLWQGGRNRQLPWVDVPSSDPSVQCNLCNMTDSGMHFSLVCTHYLRVQCH